MSDLIFWALFGAIAAYFIDNPITWVVVGGIYVLFIWGRFDKLQERLEKHIDYKIDRLELILGRKIDNK